MAETITEIRNLTLGGKEDALKPSELTKFDNQKGYSSTIIAEVVSDCKWEVGHNIQVTWSEGTKVITRAVGGTFKNVDGKITISGLLSVSKYSFDVNGQLLIGPKTKPDAVSLSVRVGNIKTPKNQKADMIINFSDTEDGATESSIKLNDLVEWIQGKTRDTEDVEFPEKKGADLDKQPKNFEIVFKKLYYNITQNTFDINVQSKEDNEIAFGDFTIKKVGFRVTNTPVTFEKAKEETKASEDGKVKTLPAADKNKTA